MSILAWTLLITLIIWGGVIIGYLLAKWNYDRRHP